VRPATQWVADPPRGWILYDADCGFCTRWAWRLARIGRVGSRGFHLAPLQAPWVRQRLGMSEADLLHEMRVLTVDDQLYGGADALLFLARQVWWSRPLATLARAPGALPLLRALYRWVARNRYEFSPACALPHVAKQGLSGQASGQGSEPRSEHTHSPGRAA
jgi:lipase maturation factor 1